MSIVIAVLAALGGILVGGAINILADDLPLRRQPGIPHYPDGSLRPVSAWLGLSAFLTGQRAPAVLTRDSESAASASRALSWRHPLVELANGAAFVALALGYPHEKNVWAWFVYVAVMLLITVIDVEHRLILFVVIIPSSVFAVIVAAVSPDGRPFVEYLIGGAFGFGLFFAMFIGGAVFAAASRHEGVAFGFGDVMLAMLSGLILGWRACIFAALITVFAGAFGAMLYLGARALLRRRYQWFTPLPYGPYIVIGTLVMLLFREQVQDFLWRGYQ